PRGSGGGWSPWERMLLRDVKYATRPGSIASEPLQSVDHARSKQSFVCVSSGIKMQCKTGTAVCDQVLCETEICGAETLTMLCEAYGEDTMSKTRVFEWHEKFKEGHEMELERTLLSDGVKIANCFNAVSEEDSGSRLPEDVPSLAEELAMLY
ncbi:hypothetical protein ANN_18694, partial [Periplaneta americana]